MTKILGLENILDTDSSSASSRVAPLPDHLTQPNVQTDYDSQSVADSISSIAESLARPEVGRDDLRYQSVEQLKRQLETAIIRSLKAKNDWEGSTNYGERMSFAAQKRVWDARLSAVGEALLERIPEEREQYIKKLHNIKQTFKDRRLAYEQSKKMQEEAQSHNDSPMHGVEGDTPNEQEETVEEIVARIKKQTQERIQRHCPPVPAVSPDPSISSGSTASTWKYIRGKLGDLKDFILGDSLEAKTNEGRGNNKLYDTKHQTEERKQPINAAATTTNKQPEDVSVRGPDGWRKVNAASVDDLSNGAIPSSPQVSETYVEIRSYAPMESPTSAYRKSGYSDSAEAEVCLQN